MTLVSIIMPMRNAQDFVDEALSSVLQEQHTPLEVIVVDDGSVDDSRVRVENFDDKRIRLMDGPRRGIAACLNAGLAQAHGSIVMRCDADDAYPAGRIQRQVDWLAEHLECDAVCGGFCTIDEKGRSIASLVVWEHPKTESIEDELRQGVMRTSLCTFAIRSTLVERLGGFREYFETGEDLDFQLRVGEDCRVGYLPINTYRYRLHSNSTTHTQRERRRVFFEQTALQFQTQRKGSGTDALMRGDPPVPPLALDTQPSPAETQIHAMLIGQAWRLLEQGRRGDALGVAARTVLHSPARWPSWRTLMFVGLRAVVGGRIKAKKARQ